MLALVNAVIVLVFVVAAAAVESYILSTSQPTVDSDFAKTELNETFRFFAKLRAVVVFLSTRSRLDRWLEDFVPSDLR